MLARYDEVKMTAGFRTICFKDMLARLSLVLFLGACVPESVHPLSDPERAKVDTRLTGLWSAIQDEEEVFLHFVPRRDGWTEVVAISYRDDRSAGDWMVFRMFPSKIDNKNYMNLLFIAEPDKWENSKRFLMARYSISPVDVLSVWVMKSKSAARAVEAGLPGRVKKGRYTDDVVITASPAEWQAFMRKVGNEELFSELFGSFKRMPH